MATLGRTVETHADATGMRDVTFELPTQTGATFAQICGELDDRMKRPKDGSSTALVAATPGRPHRSRCSLHSGRWENDWAAHASVANGLGCEDTVIR